MNSDYDTSRILCSFCGRSATEVRSMVAGNGPVYICDQCIHEAVGIVREDLPGHRDEPERARLATHTQLYPAKIKKELDKFVVGQDRAKKVLSVAVYNHYKRVEARDQGSDLDGVEIEKSNILILGPSGTGKTLLAKTLARVLAVPFCITDATGLTEAGYVGEDVESILSQLLVAADYDIDYAQRGIVFIDEFDKIARKSDNASLTRDVSGEGVQQALLKVLEGTIARVPPKGGRKHPEQNLININTQDILFICGGAFVGLSKTIARRVSSNLIGFVTGKKNHIDQHDPRVLQLVEPDDLMRYGLIPELVGRLPVVASVDPLTDEAMRAILTEPQNALVRQYQKLFAMDNVELVFDQEAIDAVVKRAQRYGTGARGLRSAMEERMLDIMYRVDAYKGVGRCRITADTILHGAAPVYERRRRSA